LIRQLLIVVFAAPFVAAAADTLDPSFEKVPFNQWLTESPNPAFHWKAHVPRAELSFHQRLESSVEIELDGADLQTRRAHGHLVFFVQMIGSDGARFQNHSSIDLSEVDENIKAATIDIAQKAFFLPGDYQLAAAIFDVSSGEHSTLQESFRIASPSADFLPNAWRSLPAVEFIGSQLSPDSWYLPEIKGRLEWASSLQSPARLNVVLNIAPSVAERGTRATPSSGLPALLPVLKVLTETGSPALSESVDLLDLGHRKDVFHQEGARELDWALLKGSLANADTASIDIHALSDSNHEAQFFVSEVRRLLRASEKPDVLVVLSTAVAFEQGEDLEAISLEALPPTRVFYIRYRAPESRPVFNPQMGGRGRRMGGPMVRTQPYSRDVIDQLEATLKPLHPKLIEVETPEQITKALREIRNAL
jgi:hypothetical protein